MISNSQTFHDLSWWTAENDKFYLDLLSTEPARLLEEVEEEECEKRHSRIFFPEKLQAQELFQEAADAGHWGAAYAYALLKLEENESHISQSAISFGYFFVKSRQKFP